MPQRGRQSPHGSPSPMHRSTASLFAPLAGEGMAEGPGDDGQPISYALAGSASFPQILDLRPKGRRSTDAPPASSFASIGAAFAFTPPDAGTSPSPRSRRASPSPPPAALDRSTPWGTDGCGDSPRPLTSGGAAAIRSEASLLQLREGGLAHRGLPPRMGGLSHRRAASGSSSTVASASDYPQRQASAGKAEHPGPGGRPSLALPR